MIQQYDKLLLGILEDSKYSFLITTTLLLHETWATLSSQMGIIFPLLFRAPGLPALR